MDTCKIFFVVPQIVGCEVLLSSWSLAPELSSVTGSSWPLLWSYIWRLWQEVLIATPVKVFHGIPITQALNDSVSDTCCMQVSEQNLHILAI